MRQFSLARRWSAQPVLMTAAVVSLVLLAASAARAAATATFSGSATGTFVNAVGGVTSGTGTANFTWGTGLPDVSSLTFAGKSFTVTSPAGYTLGSAAQQARPSFSIGTLTYHNGTIQGGTGADSVTLSAPISLTAPVAAGPTAITASLGLINTPNSTDPIASADVVDLSASIAPVKVTTSGGLPITVQPVGFGNATTGGFTQVNRFSVLEGASATADMFAQIASPCEAVVKGAVGLTASGTSMQATFTPNFGLSMGNAAGLCGYDHFNWYQTVTTDPYPPDAKSSPGVPLKTPYLDPPIGGYAYQANGDDTLPFYWGENGPTAIELPSYTTATSLSFYDAPAEPRLTGKQAVSFTTVLAGVLPDSTWDALYAWNWESNFNGTVGGVAVRGNVIEPDPGSGTGGVSILASDLSAADLPTAVREQMIGDGGQNLTLAVPEPSSFVLLSIGLVVLFRRRFVASPRCGVPN
jgi:hypothetical protein